MSDLQRTAMTINVPLERAREYFRTVSLDADVRLGEAPGHRGAEVTLTSTAHAYAELRELLRRHKQILETGEVATNAHRASAETPR